MGLSMDTSFALGKMKEPTRKGRFIVLFCVLTFETRGGGGKTAQVGKLLDGNDVDWL
jgi:hypothetical protein